MSAIQIFLKTALILAPLALKATIAAAVLNVTELSYGGRAVLVHVPPNLPPKGTRALIVVLHGGLGNARRIEAGQSEHGLNMDAVADQGGFVVAYLDGTPVTRFLGADKLGWNAGGGCCGLPAENNVDDVGYITHAIDLLATQYGIDKSRIFGIGHSNGAMMIQRLMCETGIYAAAVAISGPLNYEPKDCTAARGRKILAIHGETDANVPIAGGRGTQGLSRAVFNSEERSRQMFLKAGAMYQLQIVKGADHNLNHLESVLLKSEGKTIAEKASLFFGLLTSHPSHGS